MAEHLPVLFFYVNSRREDQLHSQIGNRSQSENSHKNLPPLSQFAVGVPVKS